MAKIITFSRVFPSTHPRKGQATHFVEQIWNGLNELGLPVPANKQLPHDFMWSILPLSNYGCKYHTIRAGSRWKVGDKFTPRVWSGEPYRSRQIVIAPDIEIKKVWSIEIWGCGKMVAIPNARPPVLATNQIGTLAKNDGLSSADFSAWFKATFEGQIICWNESIEY
jgi:hypothetical protein